MTVTEVRAFNRFYTGVIGVLDRGYLDSPYSLTEVRVLYELAHTDVAAVVDLRRDLGLDAGYLSRMLARFERDCLVVRETSPADARRQVVRLTNDGHEAFAVLDKRSDAEIEALLSPVAAADRDRLVTAMRTIRQVLRTGSREVTLRAPQPGDLGWVLHRHGVLFGAEYGLDVTFEAHVAQAVMDFVAQPDRKAGWIAEVDGQPAGSIFCMADDETTARVRMLLVEPSARGLGVGSLLVDECLRFAREAGYERITLWTLEELTAARHIYARAGFELLDSTPHDLFGRQVVGENWARST